MAEAGEGQVGPGNPELVPGRVGEHLLAAGDGPGAVHIELDGDLGVGELGGMAVHHIAPHQQALALGAEQVAAMAGGMAGGRRGAHAFHQGVARSEGLQLAGGLVGRHGVLRHVEELLRIRRRLGRHVGVQPVAGLVLADEDRGVGEGRLAVGIQQAAGVVRVQVGEQHAVHLLGLVTGRLQVAEDAA
ncbi:hypothetical protein D9M71_642830 [compost metagenome]